MCGIVGFAGFEDKKLLKKMADVVRHRGPDGFGYFISKNISLGHRRLSIIDLSKKGAQPMSNENEKIWISFNGEIYNYKNLKKDLENKGHKFKSETDTEIIIHGYEEYGIDRILELLDGIFAFALYDSSKKELFLVRDRIGIKPLYYFKNNEKIIFASEIKSILEDEEIKRKINLEALYNYLGLKYSPAPLTFFSDIYCLEPGKYLKINLKTLDAEKKEYYKLDIDYIRNYNEKRLFELLKNTVKKELIADVDVGVFLSGGLDSSTLTALASINSEKRIKTFSVGFNEPDDELKYAELISRKYDTEHTSKIVSYDNVLKMLYKINWHLDQPISDPACVPTYLIAEVAAKKVKSVLAGDGGDEMFGGYRRINDTKYLPLISKLSRNLVLKKAAPLFLKSSSRLISDINNKKLLLFISDFLKQGGKAEELYEKLLYLSFEDKEKNEIFNKKPELNIKLPSDFFDGKELRKKAELFDLKYWLPDQLLAKTDKLGMAHGLEIRVPYLNKDILDFSTKMHYKLKTNRYLFKKSVKNILPEKILKRKKQGFKVPIYRWLNNKEFLSSIRETWDSLARRNYFNKKVLENIYKNPDKFKNDHKIWSLLNFEIWHQIYIDKNG